MAPSIKLTYFNFPGLAEPIRWILKYGNVDFEDERIEKDGAEWPVLKQRAPFGQVPLLTVNGQVHHQSRPIARYCAKLAKLNGKDELEDLEIDAVVETVSDLQSKLRGVLMEQDPAKKEALKASIFSEAIPFYLDRLEKLAKDNNGHLACNKLTWADVYFTAQFDTLSVYLGANLIEKYANLTKVSNNVLNLPQIKKWIEVRPKWQL